MLCCILCYIGCKGSCEERCVQSRQLLPEPLSLIRVISDATLRRIYKYIYTHTAGHPFELTVCVAPHGSQNVDSYIYSMRSAHSTRCRILPHVYKVRIYIARSLCHFPLHSLMRYVYKSMCLSPHHLSALLSSYLVTPLSSWQLCLYMAVCALFAATRDISPPINAFSI